MDAPRAGKVAGHVDALRCPTPRPTLPYPDEGPHARGSSGRMTRASSRAAARARPRIDRLQPWIAGVGSGALHIALLLALLFAPPPTPSTPQGAAAGSRIAVEFIGESAAPADPLHPSPPMAAVPTPTETPPEPEPTPPEPAAAASRLQITQVIRADEAERRDAEDTPDAPAPPRPPQPQVRPSAAASAPVRSETPAANPPPSTERRPQVWGQPPGMLAEDTAPVNAGPTRGPAVEHGRRHESRSGEPSMEVGGYQVFYDTRSETRMRAWRDEGMTEVSMPLPGTRQRMVCPLETAIRRESGPCRLLDPDSPEMEFIGDAREIINMQQVYRRGEIVWRGPGPYR